MGTTAKKVTLKLLGKQLSLSPTTISVVISDSPLASTIVEKTKRRIWEAGGRSLIRRIEQPEMETEDVIVEPKLEARESAASARVNLCVCVLQAIPDRNAASLFPKVSK